MAESVTAIVGTAPDQACDQLELAIRDGQASLSAREVDLLTQRFGLFGAPPRSLADIGATCGLSPRAVQRQVTAALNRLNIESEMQQRLRVERRSRMPGRSRQRPDAAPRDVAGPV
jgi:DNA-directed RNA polymerase sigma subunit (sigma70/sigma32)